MYKNPEIKHPVRKTPKNHQNYKKFSFKQKNPLKLQPQVILHSPIT